MADLEQALSVIQELIDRGGRGEVVSAEEGTNAVRALLEAAEREGVDAGHLLNLRTRALTQDLGRIVGRDISPPRIDQITEEDLRVMEAWVSFTQAVVELKVSGKGLTNDELRAVARDVAAEHGVSEAEFWRGRDQWTE